MAVAAVVGDDQQSDALIPRRGVHPPFRAGYQLLWHCEGEPIAPFAVVGELAVAREVVPLGLDLDDVEFMSCVVECDDIRSALRVVPPIFHGHAHFGLDHSPLTLVLEPLDHAVGDCWSV